MIAVDGLVPQLLAGLADGPLAGHSRLSAVQGHLLERAGDPAGAARAYRTAAARATNVREQRFLALGAAGLEQH